MTWLLIGAFAMLCIAAGLDAWRMHHRQERGTWRDEHGRPW
jgi:hypothetical protein